MNKKDLAKCRPGTWLRIRFDDCQVDYIALLLTKIVKDETGDISLHCYYPTTGDCNNLAVHTQVVEVLGDVMNESVAEIMAELSSRW